ncbi:putative reverse transcriptase domain-containing protein [Tanacetum coccineum]|uniref:Reverse transcriptase domain-containing protein n=1 Tax=Tanacetum coccineum TaxID=301880 RepID=A0ABQ5DEV8_9ASTR
MTLSPGYVPDSDPEEDRRRDSEEHADYPAAEGVLSEEEEEHPAPADSSAILFVDPVPSVGDTEAFETDESAPTPRPPQIRIPFAQTRLCRDGKTVRPEPPSSQASVEARMQSAIITTMGHVLKSALTAKRLATQPVTVKADLLLLTTTTTTTTTTREPKWQIQVGSLALSVRSDCSKTKNGNQGNQAGNGNAVARAYVVGSVGTNSNSNVVMGTFLLNNRYALILFDTGADRSFVSTAFSSLIDIILTTLDHGYDVELADGRII